MIRVLSSTCGNFLFRGNCYSSGKPSTTDPIRGLTRKTEEDCGRKQHRNVEHLKKVAQEVCRITRYRPKWEETLLSDFPSFNFSDPDFLREFLKLQSNAFLSLRFLLWLSSRNGLSSDLSPCNALFHELLKANASAAAKKFLNSTNFSPSTASLERYIRCLFRDGLIPEGMDAFDKLIGTGYCPSVKTWNSALFCSLRFGRTDFVWKVYEGMMDFGVAGDVDTTGYVIQALCQANKVEKAYELLKQIIDDGAVPSRFAFTKLMSGCFKEKFSGRVSDLLHLMIKNNRTPNIHTYHEVILGLFNNGKRDEGIQIFYDIKDKGYTPDIVMYTTVIRVLCRMKRIKEARKLWYDMIQKGIIPNQHTYHALIQGYCKIGDLDQAWKLHREMCDRGYKETLVSCNTMIKGLCLNKRTTEARAVFDEMTHKGIACDVSTYNMLICGFCIEGRVVESISLLEELMRQGLRPTPNSYTHIILKLCEVGNVQKAKDLWNDMRARGLEPASCACDFIITGLCRIGYAAEGMEWLAEMLRSRLRPQKNTFEGLIFCLSQSDMLDDALLVLDTMLKIGYSLQYSVCHSLISRLCEGSSLIIKTSLEDILQANSSYEL